MIQKIGKMFSCIHVNSKKDRHLYTICNAGCLVLIWKIGVAEIKLVVWHKRNRELERIRQNMF